MKITYFPTAILALLLSSLPVALARDHYKAEYRCTLWSRRCAANGNSVLECVQDVDVYYYWTQQEFCQHGCEDAHCIDKAWNDMVDSYDARKAGKDFVPFEG
ncbi:uncharacterized protein ALTATR162_LOCUS2737 [Alternaria atra]|uniref:Uncharacterized protein n=1 Tax=Alternaria atra TaxID=119953 RepID=A0A8J2HZ27_9PLEO|nr:uncharacterized protein ALTATR162_LOCUS2737 [Alternaria atra]CAG5150670.1 unnamed protein product [Alternaria atra]